MGRLDRAALAELLGIWGVLSATPAMFIGVLDMSVAKKVIWIAVFAFDAAIVTAIVMSLLSGSRSVGSRRRIKSARIGLVLAVPISMVIGWVAGNAWEHDVRAGFERPCAIVGMGNQEYEHAFFEAYQRHGGAAALGCPLGPVQHLLGAYHQNLDGPNGRSVIMATRPAEAYVLAGAPYAAYLAIGNGDGVQSAVLAGFPYSDEVQLSGGGRIELGAGGQWRRSGLVGRDGKSWYWVPPELWSRYTDELGGTEGSLGYPVGPSRPWNDGIRQDFERGWLWYRKDRGALTEREFNGGRAAPSPSSSPSASQRLVYEVDSAGGTPHEIPTEGSVRQTFKASAPYITGIGVIAGVDPANRTAPSHQLRLELVDQRGTLLHREDVTMRNNELTRATFAPIRVEPGGTYELRVTNISRDIVGVLLNPPVGPNRKADPAARAHLIGELPNPQPHYDPVGALCGRVEGSTG